MRHGVKVQSQLVLLITLNILEKLGTMVSLKK